MSTRPRFRAPRRGSSRFWLLVGAAVGLGLAALALSVGAAARSALALPGPTPALIRLELPTSTPVPPSSTPTAEVTPTPTPEPVEGAGSGLRQGILVEVVGTGGGGLRLRDAPGLSADVRLVAVENEVFRVQDGPVSADGHAWWFLASPYSPDRMGWGVAAFLRPLD